MNAAFFQVVGHDDEIPHAARSGDAKSHVALQFDGAGDEDARRHKDGSAMIPVAGIDRVLQRLRVERLAIALRAKIGDVINARAGGILRRGRRLNPGEDVILRCIVALIENV